MLLKVQSTHIDLSAQRDKKYGEYNYWTPFLHKCSTGAAFFDEVAAFDPASVRPQAIPRLLVLFADPQFQTEGVAKIAKGGAALCVWARAVIEWHIAQIRAQPKSP